MAGAGSRFTKEGFALPKYAITAKGKSLLSWSLDSLPLELFSKVILVAQKNAVEQVDPLSVITPEQAAFVSDIVLLDLLTKGQAETVFAARAHISAEGLLIYNCDTSFVSNTLRTTLTNPGQLHDGAIGAFHGAGSHWSFAKTDCNGIVTETAEKTRISDNCLTGLYHFTRGLDFLDAYEAEASAPQGPELYVAPLYNHLIRKGRKFVLNFVDEFRPIGTPDELRTFEVIA
jgi:dTDP-glucose pyrophosphorylase